MGKILVVAEKPDAGRTMAKILGCTKKCDGYIEGNDYVVTWAIGHLVGLKNPHEHNEDFKKWNLEDLPFNFPVNNSLKVLPDTQKQFRVIKTLINRSDIDSLINAGDAGREGFLIQEWIYRMCGNKKPKKILWADSLAESTLRKAFSNPKEYTEEFRRLLMEAEARAEGDFDMGINYSRVLTLTRGSGKGALTYGRCQTPLVNQIILRDEEIANFKPTPYYQVMAVLQNEIEIFLINDKKTRVSFEKKTDAEKVASKCEGQACVVTDFKQTHKENSAPLLLDLATLQKQMGARYGFPADKTLQIAQSLYEKHKILSYPRTDSRYLTKDLFGEIKSHIKACEFGDFERMVKNIDPSNIKLNQYYNDRKVTDHHALIPNAGSFISRAYPLLSPDEKRVFDAVVLSFLAIFYPSHKYLSTEVFFDIAGETFYTKGLVTEALGYKEILKEEKDGNNENKPLPPFKKGEAFEQDQMVLVEKITQPPSKFTVASIVDLMEKHHIGTSSTRAEIIKKVLERGYITLNKTIYSSTEFGRNFIQCIPEHLKSPDLTKQFEEKLMMINEGKLEKEKFLTDLIDGITEDIKKFKADDGIKISRDGGSKTERNSFGSCPICHKGEVVENAKAYGCSNWKNGCKCTIWKTISGKKISPAIAEKLLREKKTGIIKGFSFKDGNKYDARLVMSGTGEVSLEREGVSKTDGGDKESLDDKQTFGVCPICHKGEIVENSKAYGCSNWKSGCKCTIWKSTSGIIVNPALAEKLLKEKKTGLIKGLKLRNGETFNGYLVMGANGAVNAEKAEVKA